MKENARAEFAQGIDLKNFGLDGRHVGPFLERARAQEFLSAFDVTIELGDCNFSRAQNHRPGDGLRQARMQFAGRRSPQNAGGASRMDREQD